MNANDPGRARRNFLLDIVWIKSGQRQVKWGVGNITTTDGIQVSANGMAYVRIEDGVAFNAEVIQGAMTFSDADVQRLLMPRIQGVLRATFSKWEALSLQSERDAFSEAIRAALTDALDPTFRTRTTATETSTPTSTAANIAAHPAAASAFG